MNDNFNSQQGFINGQPVSNNSNTNNVDSFSAVANNKKDNIYNNGEIPGQISSTPIASDGSNNNGQDYFIEPPKSKKEFPSFIILFVILAAAAILGYYGGLYLYNITH